MRSRNIFPLLLLALKLLLAACMGDTAPRLENLRLTSATVTDGVITVVGQNFYQGETGSMRLEACGVTLAGELVEPVTQTLLLPPGAKLTVQTGERLSAELPSEGFEPGVSDVRVIRPDGASATLEGAITCVAATDPETEEPEEPGEPDEPGGDPEDPEEPAPLGSLSVSLIPDIPARFHVTGPEGYEKTFDGTADLEDLPAGDYTITFDTFRQVVVHQGASGGSFDRDWIPREGTLDIAIEAGESQTVSMELRIEAIDHEIHLAGLPAGVDSPADPRLGLTMQRVFSDYGRGDSFTPEASATLAPGVYVISSPPFAEFESDDGYDWLGAYRAVDSDTTWVTLSSSGGAVVTTTLEYELVPSSVSFDITGLPEGVEFDGYLHRWLPGGGFSEPITDFSNLSPGAYVLAGTDVKTTVQAEHPDGLVEVGLHYKLKASAGTIILDSGDSRTIPLAYELGNGLFRVEIHSQTGGPVIGNVRIRPYGADDDAWVTFSEPTAMGTWHNYEPAPGVYEVRVDEVPADPPTHNGFRPGSRSGHGIVILESYGLNGSGNHKTVSAYYSERLD